jgi:hypothetical protein
MRGSKLLIFEYDGDGPKAKGPECPLNIAVSGLTAESEKEILPEINGLSRV